MGSGSPAPGVQTGYNPALRGEVEDKLAVRWSPQQISGWLKHTYPGIEEMQVSHETIYLTLFIQARGGLKRDSPSIYAPAEPIEDRRHSASIGEGKDRRPGDDFRTTR